MTDYAPKACNPSLPVTSLRPGGTEDDLQGVMNASVYQLPSRVSPVTGPVTSPAGDLVEVVTDREFAELIGGNPDRAGQWLLLPPGRLAILRSLWYEGEARDKSGRAVGILLKRALKFGITEADANANMLHADSVRVCLTRENNSRRTYFVKLTLLPERWLTAVQEWAPARKPEPEEPATIVEDVPLQPEEEDADESPNGHAVAPPEDPGPPALELDIASSVATALLSQVVEIISAGNGPDGGQVGAMLRAEIGSMEIRLGEQIEYGERLRRKLDLRSDELNAVKLERDNLRRRVREVEHNLKVATGADAERIIMEEVQKRLDRVLRQAPASSKGGD